MIIIHNKYYNIEHFNNHPREKDVIWHTHTDEMTKCNYNV
jgi:hypothetical protein